MKETFDPFVDELRGPRGGDIDTPGHTGKRPWREAHFNGEVLPDGTIGQHRFERNVDVATPPRKNEQPWHTMAAYMLNAGMTNSEIAMAARVTPQCVSDLRAQRWFQEKCAMIANRDGDEILGSLKSYALESIEAIHDIATNEEYDDDGHPVVNARTKLSAHLALLEHAHGKPVQKVISDISHRVAASPTEEYEAIQNELAALRSKEKPLTLQEHS